MIQVGIIENYTIKRAKARGSNDFVIVADITPKSIFEKKIFGDVADIRVIIPQIGSFVYDVEFPMKYNLLVTIDDEVDYSNNIIDFVQANPIPKVIEEYDIEGASESEITTIPNGTNVKSDYSVMKSKDSESFMAVSDNSVYLKAGESKMVMGGNEISFYGNQIHMGLPENNHMIIKETGILRMMPKCFVPPFALPDYLPNPDLMMQVAELANTVRKLKDLTQGA